MVDIVEFIFIVFLGERSNFGSIRGEENNAAFTQDLSTLYSTVNLIIDMQLNTPNPPLTDTNCIAVNDTISYQITVKNIGVNPVENAELSDIFNHNQLDFLGSTCIYTSSIVDDTTHLSYSVSSLKRGQYFTCQLNFRAVTIPYSDTGSIGIFNTASISSFNPDSDLSNNIDICLY